MMNVFFEKSDTFANLFMDRNSVCEDITYNHFMGINDAVYIMKSLILIDMHFKDYMGEVYLFEHNLLPPLIASQLCCTSTNNEELRDFNLMTSVSMSIPLKLVFDFYDKPMYAIRKNKEYIMKLVRFIISWADNEIENGNIMSVETIRRDKFDGNFDGAVSYAIGKGKRIDYLSENYLVTSEPIDKSELIYCRDELIKAYKVEKQ